MPVFPIEADTVERVMDPWVVRDAMERLGVRDPDGRAVIGVAPAQYGDQGGHAVACRVGLDGFTFGATSFETISDTADHVREIAGLGDISIKAVAVSTAGVGAALADTLRESGLPVLECDWHGRPDDTDIYRNRGVELCMRFRAWLEHGTLPNDAILAAGLQTLLVEVYRDGRLRTPDDSFWRMVGFWPHPQAVAFALTFAVRDYVPEWEG